MLKLQSEVEVQYFNQNGCQTSQYSYNENTNTNMWKKRECGIFFVSCFASNSYPEMWDEKPSALLLSSRHVSSNQAPFCFSFPDFDASEY